METQVAARRAVARGQGILCAYGRGMVEGRAYVNFLGQP